MSQDCSTCKHVMAQEYRCSKGDKAEAYCMGGGYELWEPGELYQARKIRDEKVAKASSILGEDFDGLDEQVSEEAENISTFQAPDVPYGEDLMKLASLTVEEVEKGIGRPLTEAEKSEFLKQAQAKDTLEKLARGEISEDVLIQSLDPEQQKLYSALKETMQNIEARPKSDAEGFNGVKKISVSGQITCNGCKNHSLVGCFLGKYYDCVDNGRYLFEADTSGFTLPPEAQAEKLSDEKDINFIDNMMDNIDRRKQ